MKAKIIALEAFASKISELVIDPLEYLTILIMTSLFDNLDNEYLIASAVPWTSDLIIKLTTFLSPALFKLIFLLISSFCLSEKAFLLANFLANFSSSKPKNLSPDLGK